MAQEKAKISRRTCVAKAAQERSINRRCHAAVIVCTEITTDEIQRLLNYDRTGVDRYVRILKSFTASDDAVKKEV